MEAGENPEFVASGLGLNRRTFYRWLAAYHYGGKAALAANPVPGRPPKLTPMPLATLARMARAVSRSKDELKKMVRSVLRRLQRRPEIVSSFFHVPTCAYAAP